jgi:hypothetical protein
VCPGDSVPLVFVQALSFLDQAKGEQHRAITANEDGVIKARGCAYVHTLSIHAYMYAY